MAETTAAQEIAQSTGIGKNTVLRALGGSAREDDSDLRLDTLVRLAGHFHVEAIELMQDHRTTRKMRKENSEAKTIESSAKRVLQRRPG